MDVASEAGHYHGVLIPHSGCERMIPAFASDPRASLARRFDDAMRMPLLVRGSLLVRVFCAPSVSQVGKPARAYGGRHTSLKFTSLPLRRTDGSVEPPTDGTSGWRKRAVTGRRTPQLKNAHRSGVVAPLLFYMALRLPTAQPGRAYAPSVARRVGDTLRHDRNRRVDTATYGETRTQRASCRASIGGPALAAVLRRGRSWRRNTAQAQSDY